VLENVWLGQHLSYMIGEIREKMDTFDKFFAAATGHGKPFYYQARLAGDNGGTKCESELITVPAGCGKPTAGMLALMSRTRYFSFYDRLNWGID
jgi:hypothetical protein